MAINPSVSLRLTPPLSGGGREEVFYNHLPDKPPHSPSDKASSFPPDNVPSSTPIDKRYLSIPLIRGIPISPLIRGVRGVKTLQLYKITYTNIYKLAIFKNLLNKINSILMLNIIFLQIKINIL